MDKGRCQSKMVLVLTVLEVGEGWKVEHKLLHLFFHPRLEAEPSDKGRRTKCPHPT